MIRVLVAGAGGQLGKNIRDVSSMFPSLNITYKNASELDITNPKKIKSLLNNTKYDYFINCAAYTNVDQAEIETEKAFTINQLALKNISKLCADNNITFIHISTDFVFDGNSNVAYKEADPTKPIGVYGLSKLKGEEEIKKNTKRFFTIRTSWLYSEYNKNFMKTMINLSKSKNKLGVIDDQIGTPTYAKDLAKVILTIVKDKSKAYGTYHYSNEGVASWYDFAKAIFEITKSNITLVPIKTKDYKTEAKRPHFSVLDKTKIKETMKIEIPYWKDSLQTAIINLNSK